MPDIKFGLFLPTGNFAEVLRAAQTAEAQKFYSASINDHFFTPFGPPQTPQLECFTTLSALATATSKIRLGPCVVAASFRPPPLLVKIASTLDHLSNGRLIMGLGAGWQKQEYDAHGYPYPSNAERLAQLGETIKLMKAMWTEETPTYKGRYFSVDKAYNMPRPVQKPHPPIMLGGSGSKLLELAAADADIVNFIPPIFNGKDFLQDQAAAVKFDKAELKRRIQKLHTLTAAAGRDPNSIEISGLLVISLSRSKTDAAVRATPSKLGFPNEETARRAPVLLMGTPEEVRQELRSRIAETGMTYYIVFPMSEESQTLFANEVMPEFS